MKPRQPGLDGRDCVQSSGCQLRQTILEDESDRDPRNPATLTINQINYHRTLWTLRRGSF